MSESPIELRGKSGGVVFQGTQKPPGGGSSPVSIAQIKLTDAQVKALPTTAAEIVAAPGPGKVLLPLHAYLAADTTAAVYTNISANSTLGVAVAVARPGQLLALLSPLREENGFDGTVSGLLAFGAFTGAIAGPAASIAAVPDGVVDAEYGFGAAENFPLVLGCSNAGDFTGGDPANYLRAVVTYAVVTLIP